MAHTEFTISKEESLYIVRREDGTVATWTKSAKAAHLAMERMLDVIGPTSTRTAYRWPRHGRKLCLPWTLRIVG